MFTSFEVGAVFKIVNQASPALRLISDDVYRLNKLLKEAKENLSAIGRVRLQGLGTRMKGLTEQAGQMQAAFGDTFGAMNAGIATALAETRALSAEWRAVAASAGAASRAVAGGRGMTGFAPAGGGRRGGGGRGGGLHVSGLSAPIPGGHAHFRGGGNAAMAGAGALAYGVYQEGQFEDAAFRAMFTAGVPTDKLQQQSQYLKLREIIQNATATTGAPIHQIEEATLTAIRQFAGMPWSDRMKVLPQLLEAAASEARLKGGTTVEQGMESLTGLAHMTKSYSPEQIAKLAAKFAYLSATSPMKLKQIETAAGYSIPLLQSGLEIDPFDTLLLQTAMQRAGILNTKSGTWIREMAKRAMPGTSLMSKHAFMKHESALHEIGLVDDNDKPTWFTNGKPDMAKMLDIAGERIKEIPLARRAGLEQALFGTQGAGAFSVLADPKIREQIKALRKEMEEFKTGFDFFEKYTNNSPAQQARVAFSDLQNVLMDIGSVVLPPLTAALKGFDEVLKGIKAHLPGEGSIAGPPKEGTLGAALGKGMAEGVLPGAALGWWMGGPWTGAAVGAFVGGAYEGGKYLWGTPDQGDPASAKAEKQSWNGGAVGGARTVQVSTVLNVDGRTLAEAMTLHQVREGSGPAQGSPYLDTSRLSTPYDLSLVE